LTLTAILVNFEFNSLKMTATWRVCASQGHTFNWLIVVRFSDLSYNRIETIDSDVFSGLSNLKQLYVRLLVGFNLISAATVHMQ